MSLLTDATDLAIERNLKAFLPVLLVALSAASLPAFSHGYDRFPIPCCW
jgi:hypothetical protein